MPSKSKKQQRYMGMLYHCKETGDCPNKDVEEKAKKIKKKVVKDFAETKHKGLPEKKRKKRKKRKKSKATVDFLKNLEKNLSLLGLAKEAMDIKHIIKIYKE
tara:strand:- start:6126 stop:6431 length:306 start_codon:yes stop_codon:yes gene_type:complete